jgi:hypothetical protein
MGSTHHLHNSSEQDNINMSAFKTSSKPPLGFFSLSIELRDAIYELLLITIHGVDLTGDGSVLAQVHNVCDMRLCLTSRRFALEYAARSDALLQMTAKEYLTSMPSYNLKYRLPVWLRACHKLYIDCAIAYDGMALGNEIAGHRGWVSGLAQELPRLESICIDVSINLQESPLGAKRILDLLTDLATLPKVGALKVYGREWTSDKETIEVCENGHVPETVLLAEWHLETKAFVKHVQTDIYG